MNLPHRSALRGFAFSSVSRTDVGCVRTANEDRLLERSEAALWAIADGMGGHAQGAQAAACVIEALGRIQPSPMGYMTLAEIERNLETANAMLFEVPGGSTVAALLIHEDHYACLWAGDSRIYLLRNQRLSLLTKDHSIVQQLVDEGLLREDERRHHPGAHIITRAIGVHPSSPLDRCFARVEFGDRFLLCSDGVTTCLEDADIERILRENDLSMAADHLVQECLHAGAPDNVSIVLLDVAEQR